MMARGGGSGGGGWRERLAKKKDATSSVSAESGQILRISRTGFGFVGETSTSRIRYHFQFQDVIEGDPNTLKVGDRVTYETKMNDSTMEKEAVSIRICSVSSERQSSSRRTARSTRAQTSSRSRPRPRPKPNNMNEKAQVTKDQTDQFGNQRAVDSGALLDIIDGEEGDVSVAKSCDDYAINPDGGNGFNVAYQRKRGRTISSDEEARMIGAVQARKAAAQQAVLQAEEKKRAERPSWKSRRRGGGGGSRSLSDML